MEEFNRHLSFESEEHGAWGRECGTWSREQGAWGLE